MYNDPFLMQPTNKYSNFCPCGINATGDGLEPLPEETPSVSKKVINLQAWWYIRTALVAVGAFVIINYVLRKYLE